MESNNNNNNNVIIIIIVLEVMNELVTPHRISLGVFVGRIPVALSGQRTGSRTPIAIASGSII